MSVINNFMLFQDKTYRFHVSKAEQAHVISLGDENYNNSMLFLNKKQLIEFSQTLKDYIDTLE